LAFFEGRRLVDELVVASSLNSEKGQNSLGSNLRSNNMIPQIPEELSTRIDRSPFTIMGNMMPPRDPDDEDEDEDEEEQDQEEDADEPPVVREPDED
jgi:hypothetical protein